MNAFDLPGGRLIVADVLAGLASLPDESVQCCVTSPPYWGLRDYGVEGQLGAEPTPEAFVANMVAVFREVRRVLRKDGTLWLNLGDTYSSGGRSSYDTTSENKGNRAAAGIARPTFRRDKAEVGLRPSVSTPGIKPKDLVGIPWMVAFALRSDGWFLRQDIVWAKPNAMPESTRDRCTKAHEYLFLLSKARSYVYDAEAIAEPLAESSVARLSQPTIDDQAGSDRVPGKTNGTMKAVGPRFGGSKYGDDEREESRTKSGDEWTGGGFANKRSVWRVATVGYKRAHFATFPPKLIEPCILAGCPRDGVVLDPFMGSGTTAQVAFEHGRRWIGIDLDPRNVDLVRERLAKVQPRLALEAVE